MSLGIEIADAATTRINAGTYSQSFTAGRVWVPRDAVEQLQELNVSVLTPFPTPEVVSRSANRMTFPVGVLVQKAVKDIYDNGQLDPLAVLTEEVAAQTARTSLTGATTQFTWVGQTPIEISESWLMEYGIWTAGFEATYRAI